MKVVRRRILTLAVVLLAPTFLAAADDYRLVETSGNVAVLAAGSNVPAEAAAGFPLNPGDRVVTGDGGTADVAAAAGTYFRLEGNSSFVIETPTSRWSSFRLELGRLVAKFAPSPQRPYRVSTPVAVMSVRGTELVADVADNGALQSGVVEGEVSVEPAASADTSEPAPAWTPVTMRAGAGVSVAENAPPQRLNGMPPRLRVSAEALPSIRERIPRLRERWRNLPPSERENLRRGALENRIRWTLPERVRDRLGRPSAPRPDVPRFRPRQPVRERLRRFPRGAR